MLGGDAARPIVEQLGDDALLRMAAELEHISFLPRSQLTEVVIDFLKHLRQADGALRGGKLKAQEVVSSVVEPDRLHLIVGTGQPETIPEESVVDVWSRLEERSATDIATYINGLTPNIAAMMLSQMSVTKSSGVLAAVDPEKLESLVARMIEPNESDPGLDSVIGRMVEMEFLNAKQESAEDESHLGAMGELLSLIPGDRREKILSFLQTQHEQKLKSIQKSLFTVEGLPSMLPRNVVPQIFRELGNETMIRVCKCLEQSNAETASFLLDNISSRMADQIRGDAADLPPLTDAESETVEREFLSNLMTMKKRGLIELNTAQDR